MQIILIILSTELGEIVILWLLIKQGIEKLVLITPYSRLHVCIVCMYI